MEVSLCSEKLAKFEARLPELAPWMHHFKFSDNCYTGIYPNGTMDRTETWSSSASAPDYIAQFRDAYARMDHDAKRRFFRELLAGMNLDRAKATVLDIASATGKYSMWAVEEGFGRVLSSEIRPNQCEQQRLIMECATNRDYAERITVSNDLELADNREYQELYTDKEVDVVFSLGLLYHVANPLQHILNCAAITRKYVVIYTRTRISGHSVDAWSLKQEDPDWVTLAVEGVSWVPHFHYIVQNYKKLGFSNCRIVYPDVFAQSFPDYATFGRAQMIKINMADRLHRRFGIDTYFMRNRFSRCNNYAGLDGQFFAYVLEK